MKHKILVLSLLLTGFFASQVYADQLAITNNVSNITLSGSVNNFVTRDRNGYIDGKVYTSPAIPLQIGQNFAKDVSIATASADSQAELNLDIADTESGYRIVGSASSVANTEVESLDDNDATANSEAVVDLAFTLTSDYSFTFASDIFNIKGTGESELELINTSTGTVFSQIIDENTVDLDFSGTLQAGNYTLFIGALSNAIDGDIASSSIGYDLQLMKIVADGSAQILLQKAINFDFRWTPIQMPVMQTTALIGYGPSSYNGPQPGVIRTRQSDNSQLQIRFQEYQYLDQFHVQENTDIIAFTQGVSKLNDGSMLVTGVATVTGNGIWKTVDFPDSFDGSPHVFLFAQSTTGGQPPTLHAKNVTSSSFEVAIKEEEKLKSSGHLPEKIAYLAIYHPDNQGTLMINNQQIEYRLQQLQVNHQWTAVAGTDKAIKLEEERSLDQEVGHVMETVDVMMLGDQLYAQSVTANGVDPFTIRKR